MSGSLLSAAPLPAFTALNRIRVMRLYRRALKLQMSWTPRYDIFRSQALEIRRRFEENKDISDPRILQKIIEDAEQELYENRHPDPYIPPTRPGGSKYERNIPPPRLKPPNIAKDFSNFQSWSDDQRPVWQVMLTFPVKIWRFTRDQLLFRPKPLTQSEKQQQDAQWHREIMAARFAKVEELLKDLNLPASEIPTRRRWERVIEDSKGEINEWDWDAEFADIEDAGDREALYMAIFEKATKEPRVRRERFHREAMERVKRIPKDAPPIERREFMAKEVAIAATHGHIGDQHYAQVVQGAEGESMIARDKLYKTLVVDHFIPHLQKLREVVSNRDDDSIVEQTRYFWRPKKQLIEKIDQLIALCKLERNFKDEEKAEWIYEVYMAPKLYTEMERRPGAALEYVYWTQGKECVPAGYKSPDEKRWEAEAELKEEAMKQVEEVRRSLREDFEKKGYVGVR